MKRNIREEVKALQDATAPDPQGVIFLTLEGDGSLGIYPNKEAYHASETSALLMSRCWYGKWEDWEQIIIWGQGYLDERLSQ